MWALEKSNQPTLIDIRKIYKRVLPHYFPGLENCMDKEEALRRQEIIILYAEQATGKYEI